VVVFLLAVLMGWPTIHGRFVGGDDNRLVLNHVLISRPSLGHAVKLFTIFHRDLYQPLPLLSFSVEFAIANALGLRADQVGPGGGAWIFHLTNILLHAVNAVLVWCVLLRLTRRRAVALIAAVLFAIHPLGVEVVAWTNGRMMLMSTLFALCTLLMCAKGGEQPGVRDQQGPGKKETLSWSVAGLTVLFVVLTMISKVRVGLPLLMLLVPLVKRVRPSRRWMGTWLTSVIFTIGFALLNIKATAQNEMFSHAAEKMGGSHIVRSVLAVGWYFRHLVWPSGLASWYEAPQAVSWTEGSTLAALGIIVAVFLAVAYSIRSTRVGLWGLGWFFATIASTLPLIPARNLLAADRYMYLPMIGLLWIVGAALEAAYRKVVHGPNVGWAPPTIGFQPAFSKLRGALAWVIAAVVTSALLAVSWKTSTYYESAVNKTRRIVEIHPNSVHVYERLGWAYFEEEDYEAAIRAGQKELDLHADQTACEALVLIGLSQARMGRTKSAIATLRRAVSTDPQSAMAGYRLASVLAQSGQLEEAHRLYRKVMPQLPKFNPGLVRAAKTARELGYRQEATALYQQVMDNNAYDIYAPVALAEMDAEQGNYALAISRLKKLLSWLPENTQARTNLGVCYVKTGKTDLGAKAYKTAIEHDHYAYQAMINLGLLMQLKGEQSEARKWLDRAVTASSGAVESLDALNDFLIETGRTDDAVKMWRTWGNDVGVTAQSTGRFVCALAFNGNVDQAIARAQAWPDQTERSMLVEAVRGIAAIAENRPKEAVEHLEQFCTGQAQVHRVARHSLIDAMQHFSSQHPDDPFPYYYAAMMLEADGRKNPAMAGLEVFIKLCPDQTWRNRAMQRLTALKDELRVSHGQ